MKIAFRIQQLLAMPGGGTQYILTREELTEIARELAAFPARPDEPMLSARISRKSDNREVKPADICRVMAHDLDAGTLKADGVVLVYMNRPDEGDWDCGRYLANMRADEELVALTLAKEQCMRRWLKR